MTAVLGAIANFALPNFALGNGGPQIAEKFLGMKPGIDDAMVLAEQFLAGIFGNLAKLIVDVGNAPARVGDGHDGMGVQGRFQVAQFLSVKAVDASARSKFS